MKLWSKLLTAAGVILTAFFLIDTGSWLTTGKSIGELIGGSQPPLIGAIAHQLAWMPWYLFWVLIAVVVIVLSWLMAMFIVAMYRKELRR